MIRVIRVIRVIRIIRAIRVIRVIRVVRVHSRAGSTMLFVGYIRVCYGL